MELTKEFGDILMDFFIKYDKKHKRKVKKLVAQFNGRENGCLIALCQRYNVDPSSLDGFLLSEEEKEFYKPKSEHIAATSSNIEGSNDNQESEISEDYSSDDDNSSDDVSTAQNTGNKKKKMLIVIAIAALLILGGGGYGAMLFLGGDAPTETNTEVEGATISDDDVEIYEQTEEQAIVSDSSQTDSSAVNDSTIIDSTAMNDSTANQDSLSNVESQETE